MQTIRTLLFTTLALTATQLQARATIYMVAIDPTTHSVGMAVISSGPVVTYHPSPMTGAKGIGFVGWSGAANNVSPQMDQAVFKMMQQQATPEQISNYVDQQIHQKYSRYLFISALNGTFGHVFPPQGCAQPECDVLVDGGRQFMMMGGGLQHDVVVNAMKTYSTIHQNGQLAFECKMLLGLQAIINAGGEIKEFEEARIGVDQPKLAQQESFTSTAGEDHIIADLRAQIQAKGVQCPAMLSRRVGFKKPKRNSKSIDL